MKKFPIKAEKAKVEVVEDLTIDSSDEQSEEAVVEETEAVEAEHAEEHAEEETEAVVAEDHAEEETEAVVAEDHAEEETEEETEAVVTQQSQAPGSKTSKPNQNNRGRG